MTAKQCAQIAARLSPGLRDALRAWGKAGTERNIGCILDQKPRTSYAGCVGALELGQRRADAHEWKVEIVPLRDARGRVVKYHDAYLTRA